MKQNNGGNITSTKSKCRTLLLLALPLTFAAGCASNPSSSYFTDTPAPTVASVSTQQAANQAIAHEIYAKYLTNGDFAYTMVASVNGGVVTLQGPITYTGQQRPDHVERQKIDNGISQLATVNQVKDELDMDTVPMQTEKNVAER